MMIQGAEEEPKKGTVQFYEKLYKTKINYRMISKAKMPKGRRERRKITSG